MRTAPLLAAAALLTGAPQLAAQDGGSLGVFRDLTGEWSGEAWIIMGPQGKQTLTQREWVAPAAGGIVITVRGLGTERMPDGTDAVRHDAFAIIHLDHDGKTPLMRAFTANGNWMDMDLTILPAGYDWKMNDPRTGEVRYEMRFDDQGRWVEKGYATRDGGTTWFQFFEMTLSRVASAP